MKVVDAFLYAGETEMCELRLRTLKHAVDIHIAVVCSRTHQNEPADVDTMLRSLWTAVQRAERECDVYLVEPSMELARANGDVWTRPDQERGPARTPWFQHIEKQHRNGVRDAVAKFDPSTIVLVSDVDEIPDPHLVADPLGLADRLGAHGALTCAQRFHSGALDVLHPYQPWLGTTICRLKDLDPQGQRNARTTVYDPEPEIGVLERAGWHFSWFGTDEERARKLDTFSHAELRGHFDPKVGRDTLTHSNGEPLTRLSPADLQHLDWPKPIRAAEFDIPRHWWAQ